MNSFRRCMLLMIIPLSACRQTKSSAAGDSVQGLPAQTQTIDSVNKAEIRQLIQNTLAWAASSKSIDLLPVIADTKDNSYGGFDLVKHRANLEVLKKAGFFSAAFVENYNRIIITLNRKLQNSELGNWHKGELPPFAFTNDVDPWTNAQDIPYENPWRFIEVTPINNGPGAGWFYWKWGNLPPQADTSWQQFRYRFAVVHENNAWKIDYMQGFDYRESIRGDGE